VITTVKNNIILTVFLTAFFLTLFSCGASGGSKDYEEEEIAFWVNLNLDEKLATKYVASRAFIGGDSGGMVGSSYGPFDGKFKVVAPKSFAGTSRQFVVEFRREISPLDDITVLKRFPMAVSILTAFYTIVPDVIVPEASNEITIPDAIALEVKDLKIGFNKDSEDILVKIPNLPILYKIDLSLDDPAIQAKLADGYTTNSGVITAMGETPSLSSLTDFNSAAGYCGGDDWYMIINNPDFMEGSLTTIWIVFLKSGYPIPLFYNQDLVLPEAYSMIQITPTFADPIIPIP
jgi:hypothetical protein